MRYAFLAKKMGKPTAHPHIGSLRWYHLDHDDSSSMSEFTPDEPSSNACLTPSPQVSACCRVEKSIGMYEFILGKPSPLQTFRPYRPHQLSISVTHSLECSRYTPSRVFFYCYKTVRTRVIGVFTASAIVKRHPLGLVNHVVRDHSLSSAGLLMIVKSLPNRLRNSKYARRW